MVTRLACLALLWGPIAHSASPVVLATADSTALVEAVPCNHGDSTVWPLVHAYARDKGLPPAARAVDSYRYLVLRILEACKDGDTLVLGSRDGDEGTSFRRLMVEFCEEPDIKAEKLPGLDSQSYPAASRLSCTVTKINALKGFPTNRLPTRPNLPTPAKP